MSRKPATRPERGATLQPVRVDAGGIVHEWIHHERAHPSNQIIMALAKVGYREKVLYRSPAEEVWLTMDGRIAQAKAFRRRIREEGKSK